MFSIVQMALISFGQGVWNVEYLFLDVITSPEQAIDGDGNEVIDYHTVVVSNGDFTTPRRLVLHGFKGQHIISSNDGPKIFSIVETCLPQQYVSSVARL
jgi:hypothetical protein